MLTEILTTLRTPAAVVIPTALLALAGSPAGAAQTEGLSDRPATFTYPEVQSKARAMEPAVTGSAGPNDHRAHGKQIGSGRATFYEHPGRTASGERYNPDGLTAAHSSLPLGSRIRVVNKSNGRSVVVRINDRTNEKTNAKRPYVIDLSRGSARAIGVTSVAMVALYQTD